MIMLMRKLRPTLDKDFPIGILIQLSHNQVYTENICHDSNFFATGFIGDWWSIWLRDNYRLSVGITADEHIVAWDKTVVSPVQH